MKTPCLAPDLMAQRCATARLFWASYQARDWSAARQLLCDQAVCLWWATRETFIGADAIVHVNAVYPEGWSIAPLECNPLPDGRVHTLVRVDMGKEDGCYANSFFTFAGEKIVRLEEFWSDFSPIPAWRQETRLPGHQQLPEHKQAGSF